MEKNQLVDLLQHYASSTPQEAEEVILLRNEYPYSQVFQTLAARVSKDHSLSDPQKELQLAAVYSTDRSVLKEIMTSAGGARTKMPPSTIGSQETSTSAPALTQPNNHDVDYAEELLRDLKRLTELKHTFEEAVSSLTDDTSASEGKPTKPRGRPRKKDITAPEAIIEDIQITKKKLDPESPKTKEQIAIIDEFIKVQPTIAGKVKGNSETSGTDLAAIKSGEFSDTIISETLAEILIKQGKKEKAIEVFRKLIWKFPQKKAYFAAQIEELKK